MRRDAEKNLKKITWAYIAILQNATGSDPASKAIDIL